MENPVILQENVGVVMAEICLPDHAPREYADRETLWNALEWAESGRKAQLAHSFDITAHERVFHGRKH